MNTATTNAQERRIGNLEDHIDRLEAEVARSQVALDEMVTQAELYIGERNEARAHVKTLREALEKLLPMCRPVRAEWTGQRAYEIYENAWDAAAQAALDATKEVG